MDQITIADAGPLIALAKVDRLSILEHLFDEVIIPAAVHCECLAKPGKDSHSIELAIQAGILRLVTHTMGVRPSKLPRSLGPGEQDSISLALQHQNTLLIIDDQLARRQAAKLNLSFIGTVRLLDIAERHGVIEDAEQTIKAMQNEGYRISADILDRIR